MTTANFRHIDTTSYTGKPWNKVDGPGTSFTQGDHRRQVHNLRGQEAAFTTDNCGFSVLHAPAVEKLFTSDDAVRNGYYAEVEALLRAHPPPSSGNRGVAKVIVFDHTIRRRSRDAARQPVQQVHVDQTPAAAEARVRRHVTDKAEADALLQPGRRWQIVNVWRPIENEASDMPLGVIDWRSTRPEDFVAVDLLYPRRDSLDADDDDRGKEKLPDPGSFTSTDGYEVKGETMSVAPSEKHQFYYMKDMTPDEVLLLKCFDSWGEGMEAGKEGIALRTPHTAFEDPQTPAEAPGRQSIEVRCLVFYE